MDLKGPDLCAALIVTREKRVKITVVWSVMNFHKTRRLRTLYDVSRCLWEVLRKSPKRFRRYGSQSSIFYSYSNCTMIIGFVVVRSEHERWEELRFPSYTLTSVQARRYSPGHRGTVETDAEGEMGAS